MKFADHLKSISDVRVTNNLLWMKLVEIALRHAPEEAKEVLAEIRLNDTMISEHMRDIVDED